MKTQKPISPIMEADVKRLLRDTFGQSTPEDRKAQLKRQAIGFKHFNSTGRNFSHKSAGLRFRRYGRTPK